MGFTWATSVQMSAAMQAATMARSRISMGMPGKPFLLDSVVPEIIVSSSPHDID